MRPRQIRVLRKTTTLLVSLLGLGLAACEGDPNYREKVQMGFPKIVAGFKVDGDTATLTIDPSSVGASNGCSFSIQPKEDGQNQGSASTSDNWSGTGNLSCNVNIDDDTDELYCTFSSGESKFVKVEILDD